MDYLGDVEYAEALRRRDDYLDDLEYAEADELAADNEDAELLSVLFAYWADERC